MNLRYIVKIIILNNCYRHSVLVFEIYAKIFDKIFKNMFNLQLILEEFLMIQKLNCNILEKKDLKII